MGDSKDVMAHFSGFPEGKAPFMHLPEAFLTELLPRIDDLAELQLTLLVLWRLAQQRAEVAPWITETELLSDVLVQQTLGVEGVATRLTLVLDRCVARGSLLRVTWKRADGVEEIRYLANSPRGRIAAEALRRGVLPRKVRNATRPNIFALYEQNIGPLTALISEDLREAESTYSAVWIEDAFREAVRLNKRNWKYIRAILERWDTEGRDESDRRDSEADGRRYVEGEFADFIQH